METSEVTADGDVAVFWLFADRIASNLGSARQPTVFSSVSNIPSIKLIYDRPDFKIGVYYIFSLKQS
ncbi:hypothetical protein LC653_00910 [Nostoc sp. CHAB 5784]|uniref:hypothetical protein n=1 Tax=Nostoc mirabile TaxID=2907820 RepID=UPI001E524821|nr:hypothetical protein [Nostoc mirabile]MCC5662527.1 hypothetical protein [Nostoc mirabile CHAB5784]